MVILKRCALYPEVRLEPCYHPHFYYTGSVPCTGSLKCSMCGYTSEEINKLEGRTA